MRIACHAYLSHVLSPVSPRRNQAVDRGQDHGAGPVLPLLRQPQRGAVLGRGAAAVPALPGLQLRASSPFVTELTEPGYAPYVEVEATGYAPAPCPACGGALVRRSGPHGDFWGCSNFPYCRAKGTPCGRCGGTLVRRDDRFACNREGCDYDARVPLIISAKTSSTLF